MILLSKLGILSLMLSLTLTGASLGKPVNKAVPVKTYEIQLLKLRDSTNKKLERLEDTMEKYELVKKSKRHNH